MLKLNLDRFDLAQLPTSEDDDFEFKSSGTPVEELRKKLRCAVAGFANSGGGYFVAGVDGDGNADGGIPVKIGRQDLRDWVDQAIQQIEPAPSYEIALIQNAARRGQVKSGHAVLLIAIAESNAGPHMVAPDYCYYIRAGAHTVRAKHFIVEAIWAKRHFSSPRLTHSIRLKPGKEMVIQLGIVALTDAPAIDVEISASPLPRLLQHYQNQFPMKCSVIDRNNPFYFDIAIYSGAIEQVDKEIGLNVKYADLALNRYTYETNIGIKNALPPLLMGNDPSTAIVKAIQSLEKTMAHSKHSHEQVIKVSPLLPKADRSVFQSLQGTIPELLTEMRTDLKQHPFVRELILLNQGNIYNGNPDNPVLIYYFEEHSYLRGKLRILENYALVYDITFNNVPRFVMAEELAAYLLEENQGEQSESV